MFRTHISSIVDAPVEVVWKTIRPFNSLAKWHPYVAACSIERGEVADKVGGIRRVELREGNGIVRETLLALSDREHVIAYAIIESPLPVSNYVSTLSLSEVTEGNKTFAHWSVEFDAPAEKSEEMIALLQDIFKTGLAHLNRMLNS